MKPVSDIWAIDMFTALANSDVPADCNFSTKVEAPGNLKTTAATHHLLAPADLWDMIESFNSSDRTGRWSPMSRIRAQDPSPEFQ